jgi:hypothetical protein
VRLTLREIDAILGLMGAADRHAMAEEYATEKEGDRWVADCDRAEQKLLKRYWELKDRPGS